MICPIPWIELRVWARTATVCCYSPNFADYDFLEPNFDWNGPEIREFRRKMLTEGSDSVCPDCPLKDKTTESMIEQMKRTYPGSEDKIEEIRFMMEQGITTAPPPIYVSMLTGSKCNSCCKMCWLRNLDKDKLGKVIDQDVLVRNSEVLSQADFVHFGGGDLFALSDEEIDMFLNSAKNAKIEVTTNGQGLTIDRIDKYVKTGRIHSLKISVETTDPEMYKEHCGRPIGDLLDRLRYLNGEHVTWYSSVVTKWTIGGLCDLLDFAHETGVNYVATKPPFGKTLEWMGHHDANIFANGRTPSMRSKAKSILMEYKRVAKEYGILTSGTEQMLQDLDRDFSIDTFGFSTSIDDVYRRMVKEAPDKCSFIEIGCYLGRSTSMLCEEIIKSGKDITLYCIDIWPTRERSNELWDNIKQWNGSLLIGFAENTIHYKHLVDIRILNLDSAIAHRVFEDESCWMVFIDGLHYYKSVCRDIDMFLPKVAPGGYIGGHDYGKMFPQIIKAVDERFGSDKEIIGYSWLHQVK